jgi:DNA-binding response OmpR family regulator
MFKVSIVASKKEQVGELSVGLANRGFFCSIGASDDESIEKIIVQPPDLVMIAVGDVPLDSEIRLIQRIKQEANLPLIALLSIDSLDLVDSDPSIDDFVVGPWQANEVIARAKRILKRTDTLSDKELITSGDLTIDPGSREVTFKGSRVELTFREYELLTFLARNKRKVFSREVLLHTVWGVDYYGGGRTVDVHVRRLRSKCGDSCVETVRNVGYRFRNE